MEVAVVVVGCFPTVVEESGSANDSEMGTEMESGGERVGEQNGQRRGCVQFSGDGGGTVVIGWSEVVHGGHRCGAGN